MHIGPWWIPPFTARLAITVTLALIWVVWRTPAYSCRHILGCVWLVTFGALVGGRVGYVMTHSAYFAQRAGDVWALRRIGGMHGGAALVGGVVATGLWAWLTRQRWSAVVALLTPAALCVAAGCWWNCWEWGCAWGRDVLDAPPMLRWLVAESPNLYHEVVPRYAVQVIGAGWAVMLALLSARFPARASALLASYPLGIAGLTLLRGDSSPELWGVRGDLVLNLILAAGLGWITWQTRHERLNGMTEENGNNGRINV